MVGRSFSCRRAILGVALLACVAGCATPAARARAAEMTGIVVSQFYTISKAGYDSWHGKDSRPARVASFPSHVAVVGFYLRYSGAVANKTTFSIDEYSGDGTLFHKGKTFTTTYSDGSDVTSLSGDWTDGAYHADLFINGVKVASAPFAVGKATPAPGASPTPSGPSSPARSGITIPKAYLITRQSFDAWQPDSGADPPATKTFPASATSVGIFFSYERARIGRDTFQFALYDPSGRRIGRGKLHTFGHDAGAEALNLPFDDGVTLAPGAYRAELSIDGAVRVRLPWTVGGSGGSGGVPAATSTPGSGTGISGRDLKQSDAIIDSLTPTA